MDTIRSIRWHPHTAAFIVIGALVLIVASAVTAAVSAFRPVTNLTIGSGSYQLWQADTKATREQGLSGVESLSKNGGLLMTFESDDRWGIWMKDMKISLDVIWLDSDKKVVHVEQGLDPSLSTSTSFTPKKNARYVVELAAGQVREAGIRVGMKADFESKGVE